MATAAGIQLMNLGLESLFKRFAFGPPLRPTYGAVKTKVTQKTVAKDWRLDSFQAKAVAVAHPSHIRLDDLQADRRKSLGTSTTQLTKKSFCPAHTFLPHQKNVL